MSKPGIYYLTFDYTDLAGNAAVNVSLPSTDSNITHEAGTAYEDANATWTDAVDGSGIIHAEGEVDTTKPGTYILSSTTPINVVDRTAPVITLNGDSNITHEAGTGIP